MSEGHFDRLSALDATFLELEDDSQHMHVGAVIVFDAKPLTLDHGGIDIDRIRKYVGTAILRVPRYRQRLAYVPVLRHPVWIDDDRFNIHYHVRHTGLPRPGDARQLKRLAGRIFSQKLDRTRPMWEFWVVEGLDDDRFVVITKAHHCMVDGMGGVELMASLLRIDRSDSIPEPVEWTPRPPPTGWDLASAELKRRVEGSKKLWAGLRQAIEQPSEWMTQARQVTEGLSETVSTGLQPASETSLHTPQIGPHRRFDVVRFDLSEVKRVKTRLGGKINDVVLSTVAGAMRRFLARRGSNPDEINDFRAVVPVGVKQRKSGGKLGNQVSVMLARLPVAQADAALRYETVVAENARLKETTSPERAGEIFADAGDYTGATLIAQITRLSTRLHAFNVIVTNVPGPPIPLYLLGSRLKAIYPLVPLFGTQTVGIALFSYADGLYWGLTADWQRVTDLHELSGDLTAAFDELRALADASSDNPG